MRNAGLHCWWVSMNIAAIYWRQSVTAYCRVLLHTAVLLLTTQSLSHSYVMNTLLFFVLWNAISVHLIFESNSCLTLYVVSVGEQRVRQRGRNALLKEWTGEFVEVCPSQSSKVTADFIVEPLIWTRLGVLRFWKRRSDSRWRHPLRGLREASLLNSSRSDSHPGHWACVLWLNCLLAAVKRHWNTQQ